MPNKIIPHNRIARFIPRLEPTGGSLLAKMARARRTSTAAISTRRSLNEPNRARNAQDP